MKIRVSRVGPKAAGPPYLLKVSVKCERPPPARGYEWYNAQYHHHQPCVITLLTTVEVSGPLRRECGFVSVVGWSQVLPLPPRHCRLLHSG
jgi:hypothetical protein